MADLSLFAEIVPDFDTLKKNAERDKVKIPVEAEGQSGGKKSNEALLEKQDEQNDKLGGILGGLGKIAALLGVLLSLETVLAAVEVFLGLANFGLVKLIQFIARIGSFLSTIPDKLKDIFFSVVQKISNTLLDFLQGIPLIGGAFDDRGAPTREQSDNAFGWAKDFFGLLTGRPTGLATRAATGTVNYFSGGNDRGGSRSFSNQQVDVNLELSPTNRFFQIQQAWTENTSRKID